MALRILAVGDDVKKYSGPEGLTMWVKRQTLNTHTAFSAQVTDFQNP